MDLDKQRGKWNRQSFIPLIVELNFADCYSESGKRDIGQQRQTHSLHLLDETYRQSCILGLGTY